MEDKAAHWDDVYGTKPTDAVSWYEPRPLTSLRLLDKASPARGPVIDVGAGASFLADALLADGWMDVTLLDVSAEALALVKRRLADRQVSHIVTDLLTWEPDREYAVWHDRAGFHFLTAASDQEHYVATAASAVIRGGAAVLGVFAADGPTHCSGLPTARHDADALAHLFAPWFALEHTEREEHVTPSGVVQPFTWVVLRRE